MESIDDDLNDYLDNPMNVPPIFDNDLVSSYQSNNRNRNIINNIKYWYYRGRNSLLNQISTFNRTGPILNDVPLYELDENGNGLFNDDLADDDIEWNRHYRRGTWNTKKLSKNISKLIAIILFVCISAFLLKNAFSKGSRENRVYSQRVRNKLNKFNPFLKYNNGTLDFNPINIIISINGLQGGMINKYNFPYLSKVFQLNLDGFNVTSTPYMESNFPFERIPNLWSMITGEIPIKHGMISDEFYDGELNKEFLGNDKTHNYNDIDIWRNDKYNDTQIPIWELLQRDYKFEFKVGIVDWPGSNLDYTEEVKSKYIPKHKNKKKKDKTFTKEIYEAKVKMPYYMGDSVSKEKSKHDKKTFSDSLHKIFSYIDMNKIDTRPQMVLSSINPFHGIPFQSELYDSKCQDIDEFIKLLIEGIETRQLSQFTNILLVSDSSIKSVQFKQIAIEDGIISKDFKKKKISNMYLNEEGNILKIYPQKSNQLNEIYQEIKTNLLSLNDFEDHGDDDNKDEMAEEKFNVEESIGANYKVYLNNKFPIEWNFNVKKDNHRIAPIYIVSEPGYGMIMKSKKISKSKSKNKNKNKNKNEIKKNSITDRGLFIGIGPYFNNEYVEPFNNIQMYDIMKEINGIYDKDKELEIFKHVLVPINGNQSNTIENESENKQSGYLFVDDYDLIRHDYGEGNMYNHIFAGETDEYYKSVPAFDDLELSTDNSEHEEENDQHEEHEENEETDDSENEDNVIESDDDSSKGKGGSISEEGKIYLEDTKALLENATSAASEAISGLGQAISGLVHGILGSQEDANGKDSNSNTGEGNSGTSESGNDKERTDNDNKEPVNMDTLKDKLTDLIDNVLGNIHN
ncbi:hypothetical protein TBLA_0A01360 [Henningerozyma blattae CBS 6284]|uniref:Uncharacterized protein n=1 Tax=Henningerozyma blattae (strain ATCC 34711 / CBS 6284 / DSM 70876 / NBRC 10599 / NRRL Y-10934 / UCD 77-7) TaxID=1071380 RepID=I2GUY3_HENB6|nr:hypothetical protein TBLA_0A01360 [Tetrapisispora blattae CBS 6284]CCH57935.1 hypothetical protein TBLA_0A01360 [Tetrapisispora blattae CBS 6284]